MTDAQHRIQELVDALVEAWNRHDARAWAAPFAEDSEFTNVFGMTAVGRAPMEENHRVIFRTFFKDSRVAATEIQARYLRPDVIAARVRWEMRGARDPRGNEIPLRRTLMTLIASAREGKWSIDAVHNMDVPGEGYARPLNEIVKDWERKP